MKHFFQMRPGPQRDRAKQEYYEAIARLKHISFDGGFEVHDLDGTTVYSYIGGPIGFSKHEAKALFGIYGSLS